MKNLLDLQNFCMWFPEMKTAMVISHEMPHSMLVTFQELF